MAAKHVMRYLKGTMDYGLIYDGDHDFTLIGYTLDEDEFIMTALNGLTRGYLKGTIDCGLSYDGDHDFTLSGYIDAY